MPLPEGYRPRKGDVLIAYVTAYTDVDPDEKTVWASMPGKTHERHFFDLKHIIGIFARHFEPGEFVRSVGDLTGQTGEVVAVHEGMVWVKDGHGQMQTIAANELELAPALDQPFVEPAPSHPNVPAPETETTDQEKIDRIG